MCCNNNIIKLIITHKYICTRYANSIRINTEKKVPNKPANKPKINIKYLYLYDLLKKTSCKLCPHKINT